MGGIVVERPGLSSTVQDGGRPGYAAAGVSACGAADRVAWRVGNALVGNVAAARGPADADVPAGHAAIECTRLGGAFRFDEDAWVAWTGAASLGPWRPAFVRAGSLVTCPPIADGARAYLCVRGGVAVPPVLHSRSTHVASALGGHHGRCLRAGDRLAIGPEPAAAVPQRACVEPESIPGYSARLPLRVVPAARGDWFDAAAHARLAETIWTVAAQSDRMGIRLDGPPLAAPARELPSEGMPLGSVQIPPDGRPIILFVDHQTSGGYPAIACVIGADHARLGQLQPARRFRFAWTSLEEARAALREQERALDALAGS